jgi:hypothetical protein
MLLAPHKMPVAGTAVTWGRASSLSRIRRERCENLKTLCKQSSISVSTHTTGNYCLCTQNTLSQLRSCPAPCDCQLVVSQQYIYLITKSVTPLYYNHTCQKLLKSSVHVSNTVPILPYKYCMNELVK